MRNRDELTRFLKSARGRIRPDQVGLPAGERRRAKGLRREEVAALAGMSVTWYTWFEQGRDVQLSAAMLERLSKALRLSAEEREFLFALAQHRPPPLALPADDTVPPAVQEMIDSLDVPAEVITDDWTVIAWNRMVKKVFRDYSELAPEDRNLFKILLLSERYRTNEANYREMVRWLVARFRWDFSRTSRPEVFEALIEELKRKSEVFAEYWKSTEIIAHFEGVHTVTLPVGAITFRHTSYAIEQAPSLRLVVFAPVDAASAARLRLLDDQA